MSVKPADVTILDMEASIDWRRAKGSSNLTWESAKHATRESWQRVSDAIERLPERELTRQTNPSRIGIAAACRNHGDSSSGITTSLVCDRQSYKHTSLPPSLVKSSPRFLSVYLHCDNGL